ELCLRDKGHYTVYLPAFSDRRIISVLSQIRGVQWEVFSKHNKTAFMHGNVLVRPIEHEGFLGSIAGCRGVLCAAGFETPSEALYLGKKVCVVPMKNQLEQQCNAVALSEMGVPVLHDFNAQSVYPLREWINSNKVLEVDYGDIAGEVVSRVLEAHAPILR
ncbi:MAG: glycosyltransferase family protein, partial [Robiginitalea sp.]